MNLNSVVERKRESMSKVHNDTVAQIEKNGAMVAAQVLFNKGYTRQEVYKVFDEINFYPDNGVLDEAEKHSQRNRKATKDLKVFFGFN